MSTVQQLSIVEAHELEREYERLRDYSQFSGKDIVVRAAEILKRLGKIQLSDICKRICSDFPEIDSSHVRKLLPDEYKRTQMIRDDLQNLSQTLAKRPLVQVAIGLRELGEITYSKVVANIDALEESFTKDEIDAMLSSVQHVKHAYDDRYKINEKDRLKILAAAMHYSTNFIGTHYDEVIKDKKTLSSKKVAGVIREGS